MKLLLGLFAVVGARFSSALDGVHANSHSEVRALWEAKGEFLESLSNTRVFHTLSTLPEQQKCQASFQAFQNQADSCLPQVGGIFSPMSDDNSTSVHAKINAYCATGACNDRMKVAALAVKTDCADSGVLGDVCSSRLDMASCSDNSTVCAWDAGKCHVNGQFFATIKMVLGVFCLQNTAATKYCVPSFYDFVNTRSPDIPRATTQLTNGCDECTLKIFRVWSKVEPLRAAVHFIQLSNLCLKRDNKFCAIHQMELEAARGTGAAECSSFPGELGCKVAARGCRWTGTKCEDLWTVTKLTPLCHPCTLVYAYRALFAMRLMDEFQLPDPNNDRRNAQIALGVISFAVNGVCSTDLTDQFCMPKLQAQPSDFSCTGLTNLLKNTGCCAPSVLDFAQGICSLDKALNPTSTCQTQIDGVNAQIKTCSGLTLGKTCAQLKYLIVHNAVVSGLAADWLAANKDRLIVELKKVIAFAIGIDVALITELKIAAPTAAGRRLLQNGDVQITTTISVPQFGASKSANEGLIGEIDPLGVNDAVQSTTPGGSLNTLTITGQSTTNIAVVDKSSAYSAVPVLAGLIGVFFL